MSFKLVVMPPHSDPTRYYAARIADTVTEANVVVPEDIDAAKREIADADAAIGTVPKEVLTEAKKLRWIQGLAAGPVAGWYYPELVAHPAVVTNSAGIYGEHIGTHLMAFMLALARGFQHYMPQQARREWRRLGEESIVYLPEATVLIVGVGGIGSDFARMAQPFVKRIIGIDARVRDRPPAVDELHPADRLETVLPEADFVVMTVPHTPETEGMMNARRFKLMKKTAFLLNIGRGATVKLDDLVAALKAGEIAGAGLDVFETEPLPAEHPLWSAPGVLLTPHRAAVGPYTVDRRADLIVDNCRRFATGQPLRNVVDKERWF